MFAALTNFVNGVALGPENRKVKRYLDEATCDTVSADLGKVLSSQLRGFNERELLRTIFASHCIEGQSQDRYWNQESFRSFVRGSHSEAAVSELAIQLLWRSFHFYAYHPFPRDLHNARVDFDAFQRAALLTVFQCSDLLGTRELDWFWREDAAFFDRASFERIFRSIEHRATTARSAKQDYVASAVSDAMDVLIMTIPQFMHAAPSPEQLQVAARNLFTDGPTAAHGELRQRDISILMSLLLRMRLKKEKWGSYYHRGDFAEPDPAGEKLTEALVEALTGNCNEENITSQQLFKAVDLMPNLQRRFYQFWAILFQPTIATSGANESSSTEVAQTYISGAVSLFAPQPKTEHRYQQRTSHQDTRIALEKAEVSPTLKDRTITRLIKAVTDPSSSYVVLFSNPSGRSTPRIIVGAYIPGTLHTNSSEPQNKQSKAQPSDSLLLFQLQPKFRLLSTKAGMSLSNLLTTEGRVLSLPEIAMDKEKASSPVKYRIGDPSGQGISLEIDPEKGTAMLATGNGGVHGGAITAGDDDSVRAWKVTVQDAQMQIFVVTRAVDEHG